MIIPELGDSINGAAIGRSPRSTYFWVRCLARVSAKCLGDRWTVAYQGRFDQDGNATRFRDCANCHKDRQRAKFKLPVKKPPVRAMG